MVGPSQAAPSAVDDQAPIGRPRRIEKAMRHFAPPRGRCPHDRLPGLWTFGGEALDGANAARLPGSDEGGASPALVFLVGGLDRVRLIHLLDLNSVHDDHIVGGGLGVAPRPPRGLDRELVVLGCRHGLTVIASPREGP